MEKENVTLRFYNAENPWLKESIRSLRSHLLMDNSGHKVFCVSSLYPKEGVTTVVRLLGYSISEIHKSVIVISTNLKQKDNEVLDSVFTLKDYLSGICSFDDMVIKVNEHLRITIGSNSDEDHSDLLYRDTFADLVKQLKSEYDLVLIDAPNFSMTSETTLLSKLADSLIIVVRENRVKMHDFLGFYEKLQKQNIMIKGVVLNQVSETDNLEIQLL
jgi:Mrp family chromosome partitioning ATPase